MSLWSWLSGAAILALVGACVFVVAVRMTSEAALAGVDPAAVAPPTSPNWALAATPGLSTAAEPGIAAPRFDVSPEAALDLFLEAAQAEARVTLSPPSADPLCRTLVQRSALVGYPDVISVCARALDDGGAGLVVYSRSAWGYSDMGVNAARVRRWLDAAIARARISD